MAVYDKIKISDYNNIQSKIALRLGVGTAQDGWGQNLNSQLIPTGTKVSAGKWNNLRNDIINAHTHVTGSSPSILQVLEGNKVRYNSSSPNVVYDALINNITPNKFKIHASRSKTTAKGSAVQNFPGSLGASWSASVRCPIIYSFSNSTNARHFFNSGGNLRVVTSRVGGSNTNQNATWSILLASLGLVSFGADTSTLVTYYQLTNSYQKIVTTTTTGIYSYYNQTFNIYAKCNVANNASGTANIITFLVELLDSGTGGAIYGDHVDGTITIAVNTLEATGATVPSGVFTVESPVVAFGNFVAS